MDISLQTLEYKILQTNIKRFVKKSLKIKKIRVICIPEINPASLRAPWCPNDNGQVRFCHGDIEASCKVKQGIYIEKE